MKDCSTDVKYCSFIDCLYVVGGLINQTGNDQYTSENQHIWLLSIDPSDGKTIIDTVLPGYSVLGKEPAICCSEPGGVIVVFDKAGNLKNANVVVTAFPPSLERELWERTLYTSTSMSSCFEIVPMDDKGYCVSFLSNSRNLYIYKLNSNGEVKGSFVRENAVVGGNYAIYESDNKIFLVYQKESKTRKSSGLQLMQLKFKEN